MGIDLMVFCKNCGEEMDITKKDHSLYRFSVEASCGCLDAQIAELQEQVKVMEKQLREKNDTEDK